MKPTEAEKLPGHWVGSIDDDAAAAREALAECDTIPYEDFRRELEGSG